VPFSNHLKISEYKKTTDTFKLFQTIDQNVAVKKNKNSFSDVQGPVNGRMQPCLGLQNWFTFRKA